jgi:tetratricopeptide (TPR) repeat protein
MLFRSKIIFGIWAVCTLAALIVMTGCSSSDNGTGYDIDEHLRQAWAEFDVDDYDDAVDIFTELLNHVDLDDSIEVLVGRGWSYAFLGQYDDAISDFDDVTDIQENVDARMGLATVYRDYPNYQAAASNALMVILADSNYVFSRRTTIDYKDARLIKAQAHFRIGSAQFPDAHEEINYLCSVLSITPLPDPATLTAEEYEILMAQKLEELTELIAD